MPGEGVNLPGIVTALADSQSLSVTSTFSARARPCSRRRANHVIGQVDAAALRRHHPFAPGKPSRACLCSTSMPFAMRGAHAALSPNFGAPPIPWPWQAVQAAL